MNDITEEELIRLGFTGYYQGLKWGRFIIYKKDFFYIKLIQNDESEVFLTRLKSLTHLKDLIFNLTDKQLIYNPKPDYNIRGRFQGSL